MSKEKNLELDRLVFFSDAVVAIAITLLALDLRIPKSSEVLSFSDIGHIWPKFLAYLLSFVLIAFFWQVHHKFFAYIAKIDDRLLWFNIFWLLFIITLPFSTTLLSEYFRQTTSTFLYALNMLLIAICQNMIWDYASDRPDYLKPHITEEMVYTYRFDCNVAILNAVIAMGLSFWSPVAAYLVLFVRPLVVRLFYPLSKQDRVRQIMMIYKAKEQRAQQKKLAEERKNMRENKNENAESSST